MDKVAEVRMRGGPISGGQLPEDLTPARHVLFIRRRGFHRGPEAASAARGRRVSNLRARAEKQGGGRKKALKIKAILISNRSSGSAGMCMDCLQLY